MGSCGCCSTIESVTGKPQFGFNSIDSGKICLYSACCCQHSGCYWDKGCCGRSCKLQSLSCKYVEQLNCCDAPTCCKWSDQCCCWVDQYSIPCDEEVPCMLASCGLTCFPQLK